MVEVVNVVNNKKVMMLVAVGGVKVEAEVEVEDGVCHKGWIDPKAGLHVDGVVVAESGAVVYMRCPRCHKEWSFEKEHLKNGK